MADPPPVFLPPAKSSKGKLIVFAFAATFFVLFVGSCVAVDVSERNASKENSELFLQAVLADDFDAAESFTVDPEANASFSRCNARDTLEAVEAAELGISSTYTEAETTTPFGSQRDGMTGVTYHAEFTDIDGESLNAELFAIESEDFAVCTFFIAGFGVCDGRSGALECGDVERGRLLDRERLLD